MMDDLIGIPYKDGGLSPEEGFDCYGLVYWVLTTQRGMTLPTKPPSAARWPEYVKIYRPRPPVIETFDVLLFSEILPGLINHIAIAISPSDFIHTGPQYGGVVCQPINYHYHKIIGVGRPHDH